MIDFKDAYEITINEFRKFPYTFEEVDLLDSVGRILAEDIVSDIPMPAFDNSAMDGIAVKYDADIEKWKLIGESSAGSGSKKRIKKGEAVYITTGAMIPEGCDSIIPVEDITISNSAAILSNPSAYSINRHIRRKGEDVSAGTLVIRKNTLIKQQHIAMAASCGKHKLIVYSKLKIGVYSTGSELVEISSVPSGDMIRGSNLYSILAAVKSMNMIPINLGYLDDSFENVNSFLKEALANDIDILISTGGVSAGKYDYIADVYHRAGVDIKLHGVNIKPGKPMVFGTFDRDGVKKLIFGLPGNPVSSFVNFILFVRNAFLKAIDPGYCASIFARISSDLKKKDNKIHFIRGRISAENNEFFVSPTGSQSSADVLGLSNSDCFIIFQSEKRDFEMGSVAECMMI